MALTDVHQFFDILCSRVGILGNSLEVEWLGLSALLQKAWLQSLVRKVKSHKPIDEATKT